MTLSRRRPPRPVRPRAARLVLAALLCTVLSACSGVLPLLPGARPTPSPGTSTSAGTAAPSPGEVAPTPPDGRPLEPVPPVDPPGVTDPPAGSGLGRYTAQRLDWSSCTQRLQCAQVRAPLDWAAPDGRALSLFVARIPATATPRLGTLFLNPGGPGGSGVNLLAGFSTEGLEHYDVAGWDPRGVGRSTPVRCGSDADLDRLFSLDVSPDDDAEASTLNTAVEDFGRSCLAGSGALLEHISTADTVRDLDLLRGLVGDERLSYLGFSYGTQIGAQFAETFPERTGAMVLDGAVDLGEDSEVTQIQGFERALGHFASWCAERRCGLGDDRAAVLASVKQLLTGLDATPLPGSGGRQLTQQLGLSGVLTPLYDGTAGWPGLADALKRARAGDGAALLAFADAGNQRGRDGGYGSLATAFPAIRCRDSQATSVAKADRDARDAAAKAPVLGPSGGPDVYCPLWPVAPAPEVGRIHRVGDRPVLVVGTTGDPATPYEYAVDMARDLDRAVLVTHEGEGHTAYGSSACVRRVVQAYLDDGTVPRSGVRCPSG